MNHYDINLREYWRIIKRRKAVVILTMILLILFSIGMAKVRAPSPVYEAACSVKFEKSISPLGLYARMISWGPGSEIETQMAVIKSYPVLKKVAEALGRIDTSNDADPRVGKIIADLQSQVEVNQEGNSNIVNIIVTSHKPAFAAALANQIALAYKETRTQEINQRIDEAIKFIKGQLEIVSDRLEKSEERLQEFREQHDIVALSSQSSNLLSRLTILETKLTETKEARNELSDILERIKKTVRQPASSKESFSSEKASALYRTLNGKLFDLMLQRDTLLVQYTSSHPKVVEITKQSLQISQKMMVELKSQLAMLVKREDILANEMGKIKEEIQGLPTKALRLAKLEGNTERTSKIYSLLESKHQEALIQNAEKPEEVTIIRPALEPTKPINAPNLFSSGLLGALIGLVVGLVFAFIVETFDTSLGAIDDVEETLGLPVVGLIPYVEPKDEQATLIPHHGTQSVLAESFRSLRTNLQFGVSGKTIKSIVVTSATPLEGKTVVAANLAIAMAQGGLNVLLVGTDLRKPTLYKIFGLESSPGVTDLLLGNGDFPETIRTVTDLMMGKMNIDEIMLTPGIDNLHIMTCGKIPSNPAELMQSERFKGFLDILYEHYDVIILDTPPLISAADASILAMQADGVLLVYRAGEVARGILKRVKAQLEQVKANIIGVVLNSVKAEISSDFEELKHYKYYYYYGEESKKKKGKSQKGRPGLFRLFLLLFITSFSLLGGLLWHTGIIALDQNFPEVELGLKGNAICVASVRIIKPEEVCIPHVTSPLTPVPCAIYYPYTLMVGSFRRMGNAAKASLAFRKRNLSPSWTEVDLGKKGTWFRVCVGHFETVREAVIFRKKFGLKASRIVKTIHAHEIGRFASKTELEEKVASLEKAGLSPYSIEDPQKGFRLLIGAYVTKEGADEMVHKLTEAGVDSKVVLR